jgi:hypothetical protein
LKESINLDPEQLDNHHRPIKAQYNNGRRNFSKMDLRSDGFAKCSG